jgi:ribosomal protein L30E
MHELKKSVSEGKVLYGIKQALKHSDKIDKVLVPSNCRPQIKNLLKANKIDIEAMEFSKEDIAIALELDFKCEVFGMKK